MIQRNTPVIQDSRIIEHPNYSKNLEIVEIYEPSSHKYNSHRSKLRQKLIKQGYRLDFIDKALENKAIAKTSDGKIVLIPIDTPVTSLAVLGSNFAVVGGSEC